MGSFIERKGVILLLDNYLQEGKDLYTSFSLTGKEFLTVVIEDDGFLPEEVVSLYGYFLGDFKSESTIWGRPRYFNQITVPEFWEIRGTNSNGSVWDHNRERAKIFYAEPKHKRLIKVIDWYDENGVVRASDHYNCYGALYARTIFNAKGQRVNRSYFSPKGKEVIMENFVTGNIILNYQEKIIIFNSKVELALYFLEKIDAMNSKVYYNSLSLPFFISQRMEPKHKKDILFWQEGERSDIPGNMKVILDKASNRTEKIFVQQEKSYRKLLELGASPDIVFKLGHIYPFARENQGRPQVLICTNSDRIENLMKLVTVFEELHFHIAAITEMSSKLMSMGIYKNVSLYPGVKDKILDELFEQCDFYFDINYENEIVSAIRRAFLQNHLIIGFEETVHNRELIAKEHIFMSKDVDKMVMCIKELLSDEDKMKQHLDLQRKNAMAEEKEAYLGLFT